MRPFVCLVAISCGGTAEPPPETPADSPQSLWSTLRAPSPTTVPGAARVVAIGDLHGDLGGLLRALWLADVVDDHGYWTGGETVLVQVGDQLDRGDDERTILHYLHWLAAEAARDGGAIHVLNGNHEVMNVAGDLRYVTDGGMADFAPWDEPARSGREAVFAPGAPYARLLATRNVVVQVGETVFVHGGILPQHVDYGLDRINRETQAWMRGERARPEILRGSDAPIWSRHYSSGPDIQDCADLGAVLQRLGATRMVVAHTVQPDGITSACDEQVFRVDVGLSAHYGGEAEVLEITPGGVSALRW